MHKSQQTHRDVGKYLITIGEKVEKMRMDENGRGKLYNISELLMYMLLCSI